MSELLKRSPVFIVAASGLIILIFGFLLLRPAPAPGEPNPESKANEPPPTSPVIPSPSLTPTTLPSPTATRTPIPPPTATSTSLPTAGPATEAASPGQTPRYTYEIVNTYPHDPNAFTQGLIYLDGLFYEDTGLRGRSSLRQVEPESGQVLQFLPLPEQFFGEGVTVFGDRIIQLTWQSNVGFVYDRESFEFLREFSYPTEGWGLTHDNERLIMSDGTATLYFRDPETLAEIGRVEVFDENGPVPLLNELEYINGEVFANVWRTDRIARIDPASGQVLGWVDLTGLLGPEDRAQPVDVLNGIAYDAGQDRLFVTGKLWPKLFEIELVPVE